MKRKHKKYLGSFNDSVNNDPLGSYTGVGMFGDETPEQDADDL